MRLGGRTPEEWESRQTIAREFLIERARLEKLTSYTELETVIARRAHVSPLDFDRIDERMAMADMLGAVSGWSYAEHGVLLSALVIYLNENEPGPGFYEAARSLGVLAASATQPQLEEYWLSEVGRAHARCRTSRRAGR